ncbi:hypothetical protein KEM55_009207 [Ascosphaera atra]|nr:hypothetical protein KEM55_009207 [Ascosphaera atra]
MMSFSVTYLPTGEQERPYVQVVLKHDQTDDRYAVVRQEGGMQELQQIIRGQGKVYVPGTPAATLYAFHSDHDDRVRLALHVHHASYDAVSLPRTMRALERLYADPTPERECEREIGPGLSMRDFLSFCSHNSSRDSRRDFWRTYLGETKTERKQVQRKLGAGGKRVERYERGLLRDVGGVNRWAKANGVGVQSAFLACVGRVWRDVVLGGNGDGDSVVVGVYLSNRTHPLEGLPEMLAPTVNVVPLKINLGTGHDWDANAVLESAWRVQGDLRAISSAQNAGVSLLEVKEWTGWGVDVVVNLVMVPEDEGDKSRQGDEGIKLVETKEMPRVGDDDGGACEYNNDHPYAEVYTPGVDVEAAVRDGRLDVGVFGASCD